MLGTFIFFLRILQCKEFSSTFATRGGMLMNHCLPKFGADASSGKGTRFKRAIGPAFVLAFLIAAGAVHGVSKSSGNFTDDANWKIGYWMWMSDSPYMPPPNTRNADLMYVAVGEYTPPEKGNPERELFLTWPSKVPGALQYFAVVRIGGTTPPDVAIIPELVKGYLFLKGKAFAAGQQIIGLQIDFDCPTNQLTAYSRFLQMIRGQLPKTDLLSITALLDWFTPQSKIADTLAFIDEYVPQFYDVVAPSEKEMSSGIAMPLSPAKWAPVFNFHGKPYRIGIAVFGRIAEVESDPKPSRDKSSRRTIKERYYRYSTLLDIMKHREYRLIAEKKSSSNERILFLKSTPSMCDRSERTLKVIIPTQESLKSAYEAAKSFGKFCAGVVFYRWPDKTETMILTPDEIHSVINGGQQADKVRIEAPEGYCVAVTCVDLYARLADRFPLSPVPVRIRSSIDLEYFIPAEFIKGRVTGPRMIEVQIPAYAGGPKTYLGRVVVIGRPMFTLEEN